MKGVQGEEEGGECVCIFKDEYRATSFIDRHETLRKNYKINEGLQRDYHRYVTQNKCNIQIPNASDYQKKIANLYITMKEVPHITDVLTEKINELKLKLVNINEEIKEAKKNIEAHGELIRSQFISSLTAKAKEIFLYDYSDFNEYDFYYYEEVEEIEDGD